MSEDLAPYAVVRGWRAFYFAACRKQEEPSWCLAGSAHMHLHTNPAPKAKHRHGLGRPDWAIKAGILESDHEESPVFDCWCGHYGLLYPSIEDASGMSGHPYVIMIWAEITALGPTILHTGNGFRCESYQVDRLFWPCADRDMLIPLPEEREAYSGADRNVYGVYSVEKAPIGQILPAIAKDLGVELIRRPLGVWLQEQKDLADLIKNSSLALEERP